MIDPALLLKATDHVGSQSMRVYVDLLQGTPSVRMVWASAQQQAAAELWHC